MIFLWDYYGISIGFLCDFYGVSMVVLLWYPHGISMLFYGITIGFLLDSYGIPMDPPYVSMIFLWDYCVISEGMLWELYGILMGLPLGSHGISLAFL